MRNLIKNPKEFLSSLCLFLENTLKEDIVKLDKLESILKLMNLKRIHIDLNVKKDSFDESKLKGLVKEFFNLHGYDYELSCKDIPEWNLYDFSRKGEPLGTFNFDVFQGESYNKLLITISSSFIK